MRALSFSFIYVSLLLASMLEAVAVIKAPAKHFYLEIQGKYGKQWTRVYQEGAEWICQTESNPYFVAKGNPLEGLDWKGLGKAAPAASREECRDWVKFRDSRAGVKQAEGCLMDPAIQVQVDRIQGRCRPRF